MKIYTLDEVCEILSIGKTTLYKLINTKVLKAVKIADCTRVAQDDLEEYISKIREDNLEN